MSDSTGRTPASTLLARLPPRLSARRLFWSGVVLLVTGVVVQNYLFLALFAIVGEDGLNYPGVSTVTSTLSLLLTPLGAGFLVVSFVGRSLERRRVISARRVSVAPRTISPPALTAPVLLIIGTLLTILGTVLTLNLGQWVSEMATHTSIAGDLLSIFGGPLQSALLPLGLFLVPTSFVVRLIDAETDERAGDGPLGPGTLPHTTRR
ncbi:MAG: hypothetical protein JWQ43_3451 [Glaciihabitans sp.]|nr:hypothetical protein [Glaciihabitans sp.]